MKKRLGALALAAVMLLSLAVSAFAQGFTFASDKQKVKAGEDVTVIVKINEKIENITSFALNLYFNSELFTYKDGKSFQNAIIVKGEEGAAPNQYKVINWIDLGGNGTIEAGDFISATFTAKKDLDTKTEAEFKVVMDKNTTTMVGTAEMPRFDDSIFTVTVTPVSAAYSVSTAAVNPSITVSEDTQVALTISNDVTDKYNAYYLEVAYNSNILTYKSVAPADASVTDNNGTLKIVGYGDDKTCGTDNIILTFTGKATGQANVTVQSAKVDALSNAAEKDAPAAAIKPATVTIAVGSYQVTLPDDFTGAGTAAPGSDYTFTAKDPSLTYDFTGSTMGDEEVTVVKNPDGSYTVKNVTGTLVIKTAALVTIEETGNGWSDVSRSGWTQSGDTVKAGNALNLTIEPKDGRTYVVTVNGTVLTAMSRPGMAQQIYTIPANMVTGSKLTIDVSYTEEGSITIIETGDAWSDVTVRGTWDKGGGAIDKSLVDSQFILTLRPASGKTVDDYVVTINGEVKTLKRRGPNCSTSFTPSEVAVDGKITIDVSYKKVTPAYTVSVTEYVKLNNQSIFLVTASGDVADGQVLAYSGSQMYWSEKYNAYAWLVISADTLDTVKTAAESAITAVDGTKVTIAYNGDVNLTDSVDINDAQLVWNMYNAKYEDFTSVNIRKFLEADMNGDKTLDTKDAAAIVGIILK